jgi:hypothetical protein
VPKHVLPWLQSTWWGGLALIDGVILLAALLSVLTRGRPRRNRGTQALPPAAAGITRRRAPAPASQESPGTKPMEPDGAVVGAGQRPP